VKSDPPPFSGSGFITATLAAPGLSIVLCFLGAAAAALTSSGSTADWGHAVGMLFLIALIVTLWGFVPGLVFGGLILCLIYGLRLQRWPPSLVFGAGGAVAAGLYVLVSELTHGLRPGAAFLFAPWTLMQPKFVDPGSLWWVWLSIASGGLGAGLIYAKFVKRG